jgi:ubiquinone biosynthesis protein Coq4
MVRLNYRWQFINWLSLKATSLSDALLNNRAWEYTMQDCSKMKQDSLGYSLYTYLTDNNLTFKPKLIRHDMKHILLGYEMKIEDELKLHAFLIGNKSYNLLGIVYLVTCTLFVPEMIFKLRIDYRKGKSTKKLKHVELQNYAKYNLKELRETLNVTI